MDITSFWYLLFVGVSLLLYWLVPHKVQWLILLADSVAFYLLNAAPYTIIYLIVSVGSVYLAALFFRRSQSVKSKRAVLALVIVLNVGILVLLKYTNMFLGTFRAWTGLPVPVVHWLAPLAVSYYTLQILSYLLDCYWRNDFQPEKNPLKLFLFASFFPLMVSGPICRYSQLGRQLFQEHRFDYERVVSGMRRVLWGLAKKVVVANHLALLVAPMFDNVELFSGPWVFVSAILFVVQLYFDFSGCMDIVIGVSRCFGILLPENFRAPFLSRSVQEFWQRWHITLGAWLKDYVMFPISRTAAFKNWSRKCKKKWGKSGQKIPYYAAMFVVWTLMGIWHGSSWKYVIGEGWFFWLVIVAGQLFDPLSKKCKEKLHIGRDNRLWHAFQVCRTFLLFSIGNIAFRAASLSQTFFMYRRAFVWNGIREQLLALKELGGAFGGKEALLIVGLLILAQIGSDLMLSRGKPTQALVAKQPIVLRWAAYLALVFIVMFYTVSDGVAFIYFQF